MLASEPSVLSPVSVRTGPVFPFGKDLRRVPRVTVPGTVDAVSYFTGDWNDASPSRTSAQAQYT